MLLWPTFCIHTEMLPVERVVADWGGFARPGPYIASLHYINTPKLALLQRWPVDQTYVNKKGAAHHWLPSFGIGRVSSNPLMRYIKPQSPRPPPWSWRLSLAPQFGKWFSRVLAFPTWQTRQIHSPRHWLGWGVTSGVRFGLAHLSNGL